MVDIENQVLKSMSRHISKVLINVSRYTIDYNLVNVYINICYYRVKVKMTWVMLIRGILIMELIMMFAVIMVMRELGVDS